MPETLDQKLERQAIEHNDLWMTQFRLKEDLARINNLLAKKWGEIKTTRLAIRTQKGKA